MVAVVLVFVRVGVIGWAAHEYVRWFLHYFADSAIVSLPER